MRCVSLAIVGRPRGLIAHEEFILGSERGRGGSDSTPIGLAIPFVGRSRGSMSSPWVGAPTFLDLLLYR